MLPAPMLRLFLRCCLLARFVYSMRAPRHFDCRHYIASTPPRYEMSFFTGAIADAPRWREAHVRRTYPFENDTLSRPYIDVRLQATSRGAEDRVTGVVLRRRCAPRRYSMRGAGAGALMLVPASINSATLYVVPPVARYTRIISTDAESSRMSRHHHLVVANCRGGGGGRGTRNGREGTVTFRGR